MNAPRLITEWTNFEYDPQLIKEQKLNGTSNCSANKVYLTSLSTWPNK